MKTKEDIYVVVDVSMVSPKIMFHCNGEELDVVTRLTHKLSIHSSSSRYEVMHKDDIDDTWGYFG